MQLQAVTALSCRGATSVNSCRPPQPKLRGEPETPKHHPLTLGTAGVRRATEGNGV